MLRVLYHPCVNSVLVRYWNGAIDKCGDQAFGRPVEAWPGTITIWPYPMFQKVARLALALGLQWKELSG
jgi:hypothetical protein